MDGLASALQFDPSFFGKHFRPSDWIQNGLLSLGWIIAALAVRSLVLSAVRNIKFKNPESKRTWLVQVRNWGFAVLIFGFFLIWATEIRTFALSLVAFAVAAVIGSKELILCALGGLYKMFTRPFQVGDRVVIGQHRGDVINHQMLTTTLFEVGPTAYDHQYTGREVIIPNSVLLSQAVINETMTDKYVFHTFIIPLKVPSDWKNAEEILLKSAKKICDPYLEDAKRVVEIFGHLEALETPQVDPRVTLHFPSPDKIELLVRIPVLNHHRVASEQQILREFADQFDGITLQSAVSESPKVPVVTD